jgi:hypothetical protein
MRRAVAAVVLLLLLAGCGGAVFDPGNATTQDREITAVSAVELATSGNLSLSTGNPPSLRITAGEKVIDKLTSEVDGDRLVLDAERTFGQLGEVRYELVLPEARELELSGSGEIRATGPSALTQVTISGSGDVRIEGLATDEFAADLSGSGRIVVAGEVRRQTVALDGSGDYDGRELDSADAKVTIGGSGTADVTVSGTLDAVVEGSGSITYGGGATVNSRIEGSGSVTAR